MINSTNTSQKPLLIRKTLISDFVFFCPIKNTEVPARKINVGAQKWVIHLVKKSQGVVVVRLVGSIARDAPPLTYLL
jgi:hypothetical protein